MKRLAITLSILLASLLLFVIGLGVVLMLAPGSRILGVSYVSATVGKNQISDEWNDYIEGDIRIKTDYVPVVIEVLPYTQTKVVFTQWFSGFTTDESRVPSATIERTTDGVNVETKEINKFLIGSNHELSLVVQIPLEWAKSGRHSIYIDGSNSDVSVVLRGEGVDANEVLSFDRLVFQGNGKVNIDCNLKVNEFNISTTKNFDMGEKITAKNVVFNTKSGNLFIANDVEGTIEFNSAKGSLKFASAMVLKANTTGGSILPYKDENTIYDYCAIKTNGGKVNITNITSSSMSTIETNTGNVTIGTMGNGKIISPRGKVTILSVKEVEVVGGTKEINVQNVLVSLIASSKQGKIIVGSETEAAIVKNVNAASTSGRIYVYKPTGEVNVTSTKANILVVNNSATKMNINSGEKVIAHNLTGEVNIKASRDITVSLANGCGNVVIEGQNNTRNINVSSTSKKADINYSLTTTLKDKGMARVYAGQELIGEDENLSNNVGDSHKSIAITATKCQVNLFLNK